jgi:molybdopterin converting factor small subunit
MAEAVTLLIPSALRAQTDGRDRLDVPPGTVGQLLGEVCQRFPELGRRLYRNEQRDQLNRFVNVYVNDEDIRFLDHLETTVRGGDEVAIVPAIAGG